MVEADGVENLEFEWGRKEGVGGEKKKAVKFYQSFTCNYELYDCVYLKAEQAEPYIGKLIEIREELDKTKAVKVLWFLRSSEILEYIAIEDTAENELFLASWDGECLSTVVPLDTITGICNVVCTSKDSRNPQPSDEELRAADFIFYRAIDIRRCEILDKIGEKVAGIEVKFMFNRLDLRKPSIVLNLDSDKKGVGGNAVASNETEVPSKKNLSTEHTTLTSKGISIDTLGKEHADSNAALVKRKSSLREKPASTVGVKIAEMAQSNYKMENICSYQAKSRSKVRENTDFKASLDKQKSSLREHPSSSVGVESEISKTNNRLDNIPSDNTASRSEDDSIKCEGKVGNILVRQGKVGKVVVGFEKKVKSAKDCGELQYRASKKAKFDSSVKVFYDKNELDGNDLKALPTITASEDKLRLKSAKDSQGAEKGPSKKLPDGKTKLSGGKWHKASPRQSSDVDKKMEVTRRPNVDRSTWFRGLPWEDRMKTAYEQGTLVLLQNLNPAYTSTEVEDIVWHHFKESCKAKMIQRTSISSPHCGQAFVIFKTRVAAEMVVRKLDKGCLLLSSGRPLVGSIETPCFPEKKATFFGHFVIDKLRRHMTREMVYIFTLSLSHTHISTDIKNFDSEVEFPLPLICVFVVVLLLREKLYLLHIVLSLTQLNMRWPWNGACCKKYQKSHGKSCISNNGRSLGNLSPTSSPNDR